jgi:cyclophilin family peptidyl-prolyl cis-trans isomerase
MGSLRAATVAVAAITLLSACSTSKTGAAAPPSSTPASTPAGTSSSAPSSTCSYQADPGQPASPGKDVGLPTGNEPVDGTILLRTNHGNIQIKLNGAAPCTVRSFVHLAEKQYFDNTPCHRLTTTPGLQVLQCGDPTGQGSGGPGYTIPDENPTNLKPGEPGPDGTPTAIYPRGTVAMANTGAEHSGGSQFFLVYGDSTIRPAYAVFGTVDADSLALLDAIAAGGVSGGVDGLPKLGTTIVQAVRSS